MKRIQGKRLLALHAVQHYLSDEAGAHAAALADLVPRTMRTRLDDGLTALAQVAEQLDAHARLARGAMARQRALRTALLRDHLTLLTRIARLHVAEEPALVALTTLGRRLPAEQLAAHARGMAHAAEGHAALFIREGCRPTFVAELHAAVDAFLATLHERAEHRAQGRAATVALRTGLARARQVVEVIDGILQSALAHDPDRLAGWTLVKRVPRVRHAPRQAEESDVVDVACAEVAEVAEAVEVVEAVEDVEVAEVVEVVEAAAVATAPSHASSFVLSLVPAWFASRLRPMHRVPLAAPLERVSVRTGGGERDGPVSWMSRSHAQIATRRVARTG